MIASLNGTTRGGWLAYAREMEQAGADALELNIYHIAVDPDETADRVERRHVELVLLATTLGFASPYLAK